MRPLYKKGHHLRPGNMEAHMLCCHRGQAGVDGGLREDAAEAVCGGGCTKQHVGVRAGQVRIGSKVPV